MTGARLDGSDRVRRAPVWPRRWRTVGRCPAWSMSATETAWARPPSPAHAPVTPGSTGRSGITLAALDWPAPASAATSRAGPARPIRATTIAAARDAVGRATCRQERWMSSTRWHNGVARRAAADSYDDTAARDRRRIRMEDLDGARRCRLRARTRRSEAPLGIVLRPRTRRSCTAPPWDGSPANVSNASEIVPVDTTERASHEPTSSSTLYTPCCYHWSGGLDA